MSQVKVSGNASGTGIFEIAAPNSNTNRTLTLPDNTGTLLSTASGVAVNGPAFSVYRTANQALSATTYTKVQFNLEEFDTANCFDSATNYRFTPTVAGYYQFNLCVNYASSSNINAAIVAIYKNGASYKRNDQIITVNGTNASNLSALIYCDGVTDYVEGYAWGNTSPTITGGQTVTFFQGFLARAA